MDQTEESVEMSDPVNCPAAQKVVNTTETKIGIPIEAIISPTLDSSVSPITVRTLKKIIREYLNTFLTTSCGKAGQSIARSRANVASVNAQVIARKKEEGQTIVMRVIQRQKLTARIGADICPFTNKF